MALACTDTLDRATWDAFVAAHPAGHLLQSWAWGELKGAFGWAPVRLAVLDGPRIGAAAQVLFRRRFGVSLAYVPRGPLVDWADEAVVTALLAAIREAGHARQALFLKIEPHLPDDPALPKRFRTYGLRPAATVQPRHSVVIDLDADEDELLARMKAKARYEVRLAVRSGVTVRPAHDPADVDLFYEILLETAQRQSFGIHTLAYYQAAYTLLNDAGRGTLLLAEHEGQTLAGHWIGAFAGEAIHLYGASRSEGQAYRPAYLLQWEAIRWARAHGCRRYDLWGGIGEGAGAPEQERAGGEMAGVATFKLKFCGRLGHVAHTVGAYDLVYRPLLYGVYKRVLGG